MREDANYDLGPLRSGGRTGELLQGGAHDKFSAVLVVLNLQHIRFAAHLAVFDVALPSSRRFINRGPVPFSTARALKTGFRHVSANSLAL